MRTLADLAAQQDARLQSYFNAGPHKAAGFPAPINEGRTRLYDAEQVDADLAGRPVPALPGVDDDQDLLGRREAAAAWGVSPRSWDSYKREPQLAVHQVVVGGVEHWPRGIVREVKAARPGKAAATGRPKKSGDQVPRDLILERTAPLLDADPAVSAAAVTEAFGIHTTTAQDALTALRADRMATVMERDHITAEQAAHALGYPNSRTRRATVRAATVLRRRHRPSGLASLVQLPLACTDLLDAQGLPAFGCDRRVLDPDTEPTPTPSGESLPGDLLRPTGSFYLWRARPSRGHGSVGLLTRTRATGRARASPVHPQTALTRAGTPPGVRSAQCATTAGCRRVTSRGNVLRTPLCSHGACAVPAHLSTGVRNLRRSTSCRV